LSPSERRSMSKKFEEKKNASERLLTDGMTQEEVAEVMGVKRQAVNTIEKLALRKLKYIIARKYKKEDLL